MSDISSSRRSHSRAALVAVLVTVLWSSSWVLIRWGLDDHGLRPLGFAGLRYVLAALLLGGWAATRPNLRVQFRTLDRPIVLRLALLGVIMYTLTQGAQFVALDHQPAATTSLVLSVSPLVVALAAGRVLGERPRPPQVIGAGLIILGASLYFSGDLGFTAPGMVAAVVGLLANSAAALLGREVNRGGHLPAAIITVVSMCVGAVLLLAAGLAVEGVPVLDPAGWAIVIWLASVNTALAFTLWNWSLRRLSATASAGINNTMLIQIGLLAWAFLDEAPGSIQWVGMIVVSTGVLLAQFQAAGRLQRAGGEPRGRGT